MAGDARFDGPGSDVRHQAGLQEGRILLPHCGDCASEAIAPGGSLPVNTDGGVPSSQATAILGTADVL